MTECGHGPRPGPLGAILARHAPANIEHRGQHDRSSVDAWLVFELPSWLQAVGDPVLAL